MPPGNAKTFLDASLPTDVTTNVAAIEFINEDAAGLNWESGSNEEVRARRAKSWSKVPVDASQLLHLDSDPYRITFRIRNLTNADILVEKIKGK